MSSPTKRTLDKLRELGFTAHVVEKFNSFTKQRIDAFGFGDVLCARPGFGVMLVQATSGAHHADRREKILGISAASNWLASNGKIEVWSWAKQGERGKRKLWTLRREEITADMMKAGQ